MAAVRGGRVLAVLAVALIPFLFHLIIVATSHLPVSVGFSPVWLFKLSFVTVSAVTHWAIYGGLLVTFGTTLRFGREAIITSMARRLHGPLSDEVKLYTRRATFGWCAFFAAQLATSVGLFVFAPLVMWSFFVNVLDIPLVAAMFAAEYVFRIHYLQNPPRHSLSAIVAMIADIRKLRQECAGSP